MSGETRKFGEILFWRVSLAVIGGLRSLVAPAVSIGDAMFRPDFQWICSGTLIGLGFVAGGIIGLWRARQLMRKSDPPR
jgi:hypothetical protein